MKTTRAAVVLSVLYGLSHRVAWANPDEVRHAGDQMYASLEMGSLRKGVSASPLAPPPPAELKPDLRLTTPPPVVHRPRRWGVFGAGVALFAVGYAADAGVTYGMNHSPATTSLIPVVGPLLQLSQHYSLVSTPTPTGVATVDSEALSAANGVNHAVTAVVTTGLIVDFALQLAGVAMMIAGPTSHRDGDKPKVSGSPAGLSVVF